MLKKGKTGIFGLGAEEALISVTLDAPDAPDAPDTSFVQAKEILEGLLRAMRLPARVYPGEVPAEFGLSSRLIALDIRGADPGSLIGRQGQTLASLQYLVNLMLSRKVKSRAAVLVDVDGYKRRHYEDLRSLALHMAEQVRSSGQPATLEPMPPFERRIVHLALSSYPDMVTESVGTSATRKVIIKLKQSKGEARSQSAP